MKLIYILSFCQLTHQSLHMRTESERGLIASLSLHSQMSIRFIFIFQTPFPFVCLLQETVSLTKNKLQEKGTVADFEFL